MGGYNVLLGVVPHVPEPLPGLSILLAYFLVVYRPWSLPDQLNLDWYPQLMWQPFQMPITFFRCDAGPRPSPGPPAPLISWQIPCQECKIG